MFDMRMISLAVLCAVVYYTPAVAEIRPGDGINVNNTMLRWLSGEMRI
jgi:hypothetical protein